MPVWNGLTDEAHPTQVLADLLTMQELGEHGNGPQVGLLALQAAAYTAAGSYPLDVLDAESEGMLGYLLEQELAKLLPATRAVASLLTRVEVDPQDPAFLAPTKPIGSVYTRAQADELAARRQWAMLADGAGIPVVARPDGRGLQGAEAVIDKDLCGALIASDVDAVYLDWGLATQRAVGQTTALALALAEHRFAAGSMAPKVEVACGFVRATGRRAAIGALDDIEALLAGRGGTQITVGPV